MARGCRMHVFLVSIGTCTVCTRVWRNTVFMSDIKRNILRKLREMRVLVPWIDYSRCGIAFSPKEIILVSLMRTLALFIQATLFLSSG